MSSTNTSKAKQTISFIDDNSKRLVAYNKRKKALIKKVISK